MKMEECENCEQPLNNCKCSEEELVSKETKRNKQLKETNSDQLMGDVYDVYAKASGIHSRISGMTEDYTLTRYDRDIYNDKFPKFIREQRKLLRIIKSYILIPLEILEKRYNTKETAKMIYIGLLREYNIIEELLIGELDECVIMGRTPRGEVIKAFLEHGLNNEMKEMIEAERGRDTTQGRLNERGRA